MNYNADDPALQGLMEDSDEVARVFKEDGSFDKLRSLIKDECSTFLTTRAEDVIKTSDRVKDVLYGQPYAQQISQVPELIRDICSKEERGMLDQAAQNCWELLYKEDGKIGRQLLSDIERVLEKIIAQRRAAAQPEAVGPQVQSPKAVVEDATQA